MPGVKPKGRLEKSSPWQCIVVFMAFERQVADTIAIRLRNHCIMVTRVLASRVRSTVNKPHTVSLPNVPEKQPPAEPRKIVVEWVDKFRASLAQANVSDLQKLFLTDAWLRDMVVLSWDLRTINGAYKVAAYFQENLGRAKFEKFHPRESGQFEPQFKTVKPGLQWIETMFDFETETGKGPGMLWLVRDSDDIWKAYMLGFVLQVVKGYEEISGLNRPNKGSDAIVDNPRQEKSFTDIEPTVLVIGAGQAGLMIGARLGKLGIPTLIIERNSRVGDNWRKRYRTLVTHDPVQYSQMPYLPFPSGWPLYTPKDKLADWLETYARGMELNVWTNTEIEKSEYDEKSKTWSVKVRSNDCVIRTVYPHHIVLATGHSGEPLRPNFPGKEKFKGEIYHSSQYNDASEHAGIKSKKVVVVGTGNSGHDIAQDFYENGAEVAMLQRRGTFVISQKHGVKQSDEGIEQFDSDGLVLADGKRTKLAADIVVLATGYDNMKSTARKIMGDKVADKLYSSWGLDEEGELNAMWRYSGHPNFWNGKALRILV
ncbi:predicted protein [Histoplasma mississippiense (nom. inval.)]|uniref:predicted protein n=1 Tax=Ajellomyces capsulatus (strain NAm1 / WU24) TaxID=2059318 RepID=UPI000157BCBE|nr:predicted protein [Histoplasma mississippiense (nom. inval.)]EDN06241.1 predicted protein [Histoplasma mississippiense (nom. inval.)]